MGENLRDSRSVSEGLGTLGFQNRRRRFSYGGGGDHDGSATALPAWSSLGWQQEALKTDLVFGVTAPASGSLLGFSDYDGFVVMSWSWFSVHDGFLEVAKSWLGVPAPVLVIGSEITPASLGGGAIIGRRTWGGHPPDVILSREEFEAPPFSLVVELNEETEVGRGVAAGVGVWVVTAKNPKDTLGWADGSGLGLTGLMAWLIGLEVDLSGCWVVWAWDAGPGLSVE